MPTRATFRERPPWLARIDRGPAAVGAGVLISPDLVITCAHVVAAALGTSERDPSPPAGEVSLSLVNAEGGPVSATGCVEPGGWIPVGEDDRGDLAVLRLRAPVVDAVAARLRAPDALADHQYVVQGFPDGRRYVAETRGRLGGRVGPGWVQLDDERMAGHLIDRGFSGAPVWDDTVQAVVGIVVSRERDAALRVGHMIPISEIAQLWPRAKDFTGWRLDLDESVDTHWLPRARGVEPDEATDVWHFVGRHRALGELATWLNPMSAPDGRARVVTGSPGSGKSAVIARLVVLADRTWRGRIPEENLPGDVPTPPLGCVTVAIHARSRTLLDVITDIADATEIEATDTAQLMQALQRLGRPVTIVVDALDEAEGDAPVGIATLLSRIAADPARLGFRVLVGTRVGARGAGANLLLSRLGNPVIIDLDDGYLDHDDVITYVTRRLTSDYPAAGEHAEELPVVAQAIAERANGNFLIAQLASVTALSALRDATPVESWADRLPTTVASAIDVYLDIRFGARARVVRDLLLPLAFAEGPGLREGPLWIALANALAASAYTEGDLREVLTSAASYLVQEVGVDPPAYRLFHQALDDTFRRQYEERNPGRNPDRVVYEALLSQVPVDAGTHPRWPEAPDYVLAHLSAHAVAAGRIDSIVEDVGYLAVVDPERIVPQLTHVASDRARIAAGVYRRASDELVGRDCPNRAAYLALVARQMGFASLAEEFAQRFHPLPWSAELIAWDVDSAQQVLLRLPMTFDIALWLDAEGNPAALAGPDNAAVLYRFVDYRLVEDSTVELGIGRQIFQAHKPLVLADGREVGVSVNGNSELMKWSFSDGLRLCGAVPLGEYHGVTWDVDMINLPDGQLLAVVAHPDAVMLIDATADLPEVLHRLPLTHNRSRASSASATIGLQDGEVFIGIFDETAVRLYTVVDHELVELGEPLRDHQINPAALRFLPRSDGRLLLVSASAELLVVSEITASGMSTVSSTEGLVVRSITSATLPDGRQLAALGDLLGQLHMMSVDLDLAPIAEPRRSHELGVDTLAIGPGPFGSPVALSASLDGLVRMSDVDYVPPAAPDLPPPYGITIKHVELLDVGEEILAAVFGWGSDDPPEVLVVADQLMVLGDPLRMPDGSRLVKSLAVDFSPGGQLTVAAVSFGDRLDAWVLGDDGWIHLASGEVSTDNDTDPPVTVTLDETGSPLVAVGGASGAVRCYQLEDGNWRQFAECLPTEDEGPFGSYELEITRLRFYSAADNTLRLIARSGSNLHSFGVPVDGELEQLATSDLVSTFAVIHHDIGPVAGLLRHSVEVDGFQLVALNDDAFDPLIPPVPCTMQAGPVVAVANAPGGRIRCAVSGNEGRLEVWSATPRGGVRSLGVIQVNSAVEGLVWAEDGALVVWCQSGVIRIRGVGW